MAPFLVLLPLMVLFISLVFSQQIGNLVPESHPKLPIKHCTATGCKVLDTSVVLDANFRPLHGVDGYEDCIKDGTLDNRLCPDVDQCARNCALEGVDYEGAGVTTEGDSLTLRLFMPQQYDPTQYEKAAPRVYLLAKEDRYQMMTLLNQEFTFDVDVSRLPCGVNGALYLSEMRPGGSRSDNNVAGARYGTGYCDAQCPTTLFVDGKANIDLRRGACCNEFDIWEANKEATLYSSHPCSKSYVHPCSGVDCGHDSNYYKGVCVRQGCDFNPYRLGATSFYGPGLTVDTKRRFTVVTQFITSNGLLNGTLIEFRRHYIQDGRMIANPPVGLEGIVGSTVSEEFCKSQKELFKATNNYTPLGGTPAMGEAIRRGMVLAFSIWYDEGGRMLWLDSKLPTNADPSTPGVLRGPCPVDSGHPEDLRLNHHDSAVTYSNIRFGDIGSTTNQPDGC